MARPSLEEVTTNAAILFPDNNTKLITPAKLRQFISELIGAIRPAYGYLVQTANLVKSLTTTPSSATYTSGIVSPVIDFGTNITTGVITRNDKGMTTINFTADVLGSVNATRLVTFTLFKNGAPTVWRQSVSLSTNNLVESVSFTALEYEGVAAAQYEIRISSDVATSVTLSQMVFLAETVPVWSYT